MDVRGESGAEVGGFEAGGGLVIGRRSLGEGDGWEVDPHC